MSRPRIEKRLSDVCQFYDLLIRLERKLGGKRTLAEAHGRMYWPERGVYFFFEPGERRTTSGSGPRVVRVGTHALKEGSKSTLWSRLHQHRGTLRGKYAGGGNHRGSIFRLHVGTALIAKHNLSGMAVDHWAVGSTSPTSHTREDEYPLECLVSEYIRSMPFLWLAVEDQAGPASLRGYIERNTIAMLSNYNASSRLIDPPSECWLGHWAANDAVRLSGLWNVDHVAHQYDPPLLKWLGTSIAD